MKTIGKNIFLSILLTNISLLIYGQGVSISPSRLYFDADIGQTQVKRITVTNNSKTNQTYTISFADFSSPGNDGKATIDTVKTEHSLSQWLGASQSLIELQAGESRDVEIILQLPNSKEAARVAWSTLTLKLSKERKAPDELSESSMGFGIMHTFQIVIYIFQSPPSVTFKEAQILAFEDGGLDVNGKKRVKLHLKNTGETILDVAAYLELTNTSTGITKREKAMAFTTLPGHDRIFYFTLSDDLASGKYSVLGVVDYGDRDAVIGAELELTIP